MLKHWQTHDEYKLFLISSLKNSFLYYQLKITQLSKTISKLYILNLDSLQDIASSLYSSTGRPANNQPTIMRSFILMSELGEYSITNWVAELRSNALLSYLIGVEPHNVPSIGAHYDFINRFWCADDNYDKPKILHLHRKPKKKYKKNEKKPPKNKETVKKLVAQILKGRSLKRRPERIFQSIFKKIAVEPSTNFGLLGNTSKLSVSGDGTCIETGASSRGLKFVLAEIMVFTTVTVNETFLTLTQLGVGIVIMKDGIMDTQVFFFLYITRLLNLIYLFTLELLKLKGMIVVQELLL